MAESTIRRAESAEDVSLVRGLMRAYGEFLIANQAGRVNVCLQGFEQETLGLPVPYVAPGVLLLAEKDGAAVGCVALKKLARSGATAEEDGRSSQAIALELKRLWVCPEARGEGLGRRLMEAAIEQARSVGAGELYLDTVPASMPEANRMYARIGFEPVERYNDNPAERVSFFRLKL